MDIIKEKENLIVKWSRNTYTFNLKTLEVDGLRKKNIKIPKTVIDKIWGYDETERLFCSCWIIREANIDNKQELITLLERLYSINKTILLSHWEAENNKFIHLFSKLNFKDFQKAEAETFSYNDIYKLFINNVVEKYDLNEAQKRVIYDFESMDLEKIDYLARQLKFKNVNYLIDRVEIINFFKNCELLKEDYKNYKSILTGYIETSMKMEANRNRILLEAFSEKFIKYSQLVFENEKYIVKIPKTPEEIINEGIQNRNCVGSYVNNYACDRAIIVFIREKNNFEKSFITCELTKKLEIAQFKKFANSTKLSEEEKNFKKEYSEYLKTIKSTF